MWQLKVFFLEYSVLMINFTDNGGNISNSFHICCLFLINVWTSFWYLNHIWKYSFPGKPYCVSFDIVTDERFRSSNERLEKQLKLLKGIGRTITHKQPISIADLRRMYDSGVLGTSNPLSLLRKVSNNYNFLIKIISAAENEQCR